MEKIYLKTHKIGADIILAAADKSVLGKKHTGGGRVLDLLSYRQFYEGELVDEKKLISAFCECTTANLAGERAVSLAIREGFAKKGDIVRIGSCPHLQIFRIRFAEEHPALKGKV